MLQSSCFDPGHGTCWNPIWWLELLICRNWVIINGHLFPVPIKWKTDIHWHLQFILSFNTKYMWSRHFFSWSKHEGKGLWRSRYQTRPGKIVHSPNLPTIPSNSCCILLFPPYPFIKAVYFKISWQVGGRVVPGPLFDFGLHMFHNSKLMMKEGNGPFFYLPKVWIRFFSLSNQGKVYYNQGRVCQWQMKCLFVLTLNFFFRTRSTMIWVLQLLPGVWTLLGLITWRFFQPSVVL